MEEEEDTVWVDWGGSPLRVPEIKRSQQAYEQGAYEQAYSSLRRVRERVRQGSVKVETPTFEPQLENNLAVAAHKGSRRVDDTDRQRRLESVAEHYIARAAEKRTSALELSDAIEHNLRLIKRK